jgi:phage-related protein
VIRLVQGARGFLNLARRFESSRGHYDLAAAKTEHQAASFGMYHLWYTTRMTEPGGKLILSVVFYATAGGNEPVRDWLLGLSRDDRRTVGFDIKTAQYGWPLGMPLIRKLEPDLWEIRSHIGDGIARVLFTVRGDTMVLLHGFVKKSQKTPTTDFKTAKQRMADVQER